MTSDHAEFVFERELAFLLVDAGRKLNDAYDQTMKPLGLTRSQWRVMAYVSRSPGISQTELAESVECTRMAITGLLDRMQLKSLIERRAVTGDRRLRAVHLTSKGQALVKQMNRTAVEVLDQIFSGSSDSDRRKLHQLLMDIKANASDVLEQALLSEKQAPNGTG